MAATTTTTGEAMDRMVKVSVEEVEAATLLLAVLVAMVAATMAGMPVEAAATPPLEQAMGALLVGTTVMGAMEAMPMAAMGAMGAVATLVMEQAMGAALVGMASPSTQLTANLLQAATFSDVGT